MYRKFTATHIFNGFEMLPPSAVLVIDPDGTIVEIISKQDAGDNIEVLDGILTPGFINAHCHVELSHLKGLIPEHTGLIDFVFKIITERNTNAEKIQQSIIDAEAEMLQNGIVAVGDICNTTDTVAQKKITKLHYHNFIEVAGFVAAGAQNRFDTALQTLHQFKTPATISPHAPYSVSPQLFSLINQHPNNNLITIHNQETDAEDEFFKTGSGEFLRLYTQLGIDISFYKPSGKSSVQTILPQFTNQQQLLLVHDVCTDENDIKTVQETINNRKLHAAFFCLCPNANIYISNRLPDVNTLLNNDCNIVLGTDSLASNHQLSILEEMKTLLQHFPQLKTEQLLQWATINGARALQMDSKLGSFEKGKKPGLVLLKSVNENKLTQQSTVQRII